MSGHSKKIIEIRDVSFEYPNKRKALDGISLEISEGQIKGLLGPNGGGKTTLFKIISSLIRNYRGSIWIDGMEQKSNLAKVLSKLGVVFQSPSLDKKLTVDENLKYHGYLYGLSKKQIEVKIQPLLETFSLADRRKDLIDELSGGLQRRVEIIKALLHSPKVLVLDEPSTGLDINVRLDLWGFLRRIREEQSVTILLTTHFIEEADRCDDITILDRGRVLSSGSPSELKSKLTFKQFQVKPRNMDAMKSTLSGKFQVSARQENGFLQFQVPPEKAKEIANELAPDAEELLCRDPTLEDVFVHYAGHRLAAVGS